MRDLKRQKIYKKQEFLATNWTRLFIVLKIFRTEPLINLHQSLLACASNQNMNGYHRSKAHNTFVDSNMSQRLHQKFSSLEEAVKRISVLFILIYGST